MSEKKRVASHYFKDKCEIKRASVVLVQYTGEKRIYSSIFFEIVDFFVRRKYL